MRRQGMDDELEGGEGHNLLVGGLYADCFIFRAGEEARHEVADLEPWDFLSFEGFGYTDAGQIRARLVQEGNAMVFSDQGVSVTLQEIAHSDLHDDMFLF